MYSNRQTFLVGGGNNDFKDFYDVFYEFDVDFPDKPVTLEKLPLPV